MASEVDDQTKRPAMLKSESRPTKPPAAATATVDVPSSPRKKSWIIGLACSRMPMPAVTLQNRTTQSSQNWGVRMALAAVTSWVDDERLRRDLGGVESRGGPVGCGNADERDADHHEHEVDDAEGDEEQGQGVSVGEGGRDRGPVVAVVGGQELPRQRAGEQRAAAEAHDGETGGETGAVGEPLDEGGDGGDVADAEPDAADDAVAEVDEPELGRRDAQRARRGSRPPTRTPRRTSPCEVRCARPRCRGRRPRDRA